MNRRIRFAGLLLTLLFVLAPGAAAGGWAVLTLDELPGGVSAGETLAIGYTVRQHGQTLLSDLDTIVRASNEETGEHLTAFGQSGQGNGHYTAELVFPSEGTWAWSIEAFNYVYRMPPLAVSADAGLAASVSLSPVPMLVLSLAGLGLAAVAGLIAWRTRSRVAIGLAVALLVVGVAGFTMVERGVAQAETVAPSADTASISDYASEAEYGAALFVAKGCVVCHTHSRASVQYESFNIGPALTEFSSAAEYLRLWLADPSSVKPKTFMPNLELSAAEIEALIAFLNQDS